MKKNVIAFVTFCIVFILALVFIKYTANPNNELSPEVIDINWHGRVENTSGTYIGSLIGDCFSGDGDFYFLTGEIYTGNWDNSFMSGDGTIIFPDAGEYSGSLTNSERNGQGSFLFTNGDQYSGNWKNDKMSGTGTYKFSNGDKYVGSWSDNQMSGEGTYTFKNGGKIVGTFSQNNLIKGKYTRTFKLAADAEESDLTYIEYTFSDKSQNIVFKAKNGLSFNGELSALFDGGNATITYPSGDTYSGKLVDGKRFGEGKYCWYDDSGKINAYYEGNWQNDKMNGTGKYHYKNSMYPYLYGNYVNDTPTGTLTYYKEANNTFTTYWVNGECSEVKED